MNDAIFLIDYVMLTKNTCNSYLARDFVDSQMSIFLYIQIALVTFSHTVVTGIDSNHLHNTD